MNQSNQRLLVSAILIHAGAVIFSAGLIADANVNIAKEEELGLLGRIAGVVVASIGLIYGSSQGITTGYQRIRVVLGGKERDWKDSIIARLTRIDTDGLDNRIVIRFELNNPTKRDIYVLKYNTPLEGLCGDYLTVTRGGKRIAYDGVLVKRKMPRKEDYAHVAHGESVTAEIDITTAYEVGNGGDYVVELSFDLLCLEQLPAASESRMLAKTRALHHTVRRPVTDSCQFSISESSAKAKLERRRTLGERARQRARRMAKEGPLSDSASRESGFRVPRLVGGTEAEQQQARTAYENAFEMVQTSLANLNATDSLYETWFGVRSSERETKVTGIYQSVQAIMQETQVALDLTGDGCGSGWYAYTYMGAREIWLCGSFWSANAIGFDSQPGTMVHELSHAAAYTEDYRYGQDECMDLAETDPERAVNNADNYEYFCEEGSLEQADT